MAWGQALMAIAWENCSLVILTLAMSRWEDWWGVCWDAEKALPMAELQDEVLLEAVRERMLLDGMEPTMELRLLVLELPNEKDVVKEKELQEELVVTKWEPTLALLWDSACRALI